LYPLISPAHSARLGKASRQHACGDALVHIHAQLDRRVTRSKEALQTAVPPARDPCREMLSQWSSRVGAVQPSQTRRCRSAQQKSNSLCTPAVLAPALPAPVQAVARTAVLAMALGSPVQALARIRYIPPCKLPPRGVRSPATPIAAASQWAPARQRQQVRAAGGWLRRVRAVNGAGAGAVPRHLHLLLKCAEEHGRGRRRPGGGGLRDKMCLLFAVYLVFLVGNLVYFPFFLFTLPWVSLSISSWSGGFEGGEVVFEVIWQCNI
jgi:hypothetical protein